MTDRDRVAIAARALVVEKRNGLWDVRDVSGGTGDKVAGHSGYKTKAEAAKARASLVAGGYEPDDPTLPFD